MGQEQQGNEKHRWEQTRWGVLGTLLRWERAAEKDSRKKQANPSVTSSCLILDRAVAQGRLVILYNVGRKTCGSVSLV